jgi:lysophospholipase L1-like esterase
MSPPAKSRRIGRGLLLLAVSLVLVVVGAEVVLRVLGHQYQQRHWQRVTAEHAASRARATVLALGESTTAGLWLPFEQSYPKQLEARLRAHYGSDRISVVVPPHLGQNTSQMVARMPFYLSTFRPDVVVIMAGVNNAWSLVESDLPRFLPESDWRTPLFRWRRWLDDVKVLRLASLVWSASRERLSRFGHELGGAPRFTEWPPKAGLLGAVDSNGEPILQLWRHDVGTMIDLAHRAGATVILMTYPNYDTPPLAEFRAMARAKGVRLVDNHHAFRPLVTPDVISTYFLADYRHPSAKGYAIVAEHALQAIVETPAITSRLGRPDGPSRPQAGP